MIIHVGSLRATSSYLGPGLLGIRTNLGGVIVAPDPGPPNLDGYFLKKNSTVDTGTEWAAITSPVVFYDAVSPPEAPDGTDGTDGNDTFTLPAEPNPASSLQCTVEGVTRYEGVHYDLVADQITFRTLYIPVENDRIVCWFRGV